MPRDVVHQAPYGPAAAALLLLAVPLAGCLGETAGIEWVDPPDEAAPNEPIQLSYTIEGPDGDASETGVRYGMDSVSDPQSPTDYPEGKVVQTDAAVPGTYNATVRSNETGVLYVRAYAIADGETAWSDELSIRIQEGLEVGGEAPFGAGTMQVSLQVEPAVVDQGDSVNATWNITRPSDVEAELLTILGRVEGAEGNETGNATGNETDEEELLNVPNPDDNGTRSIELTETGTWTIRARVTDENGRDSFSSEVTIRVGAAGAGANWTIELSDVGLPPFRFEPDNMTIRIGDTVTWQNNGTLSHRIVFEDLNGTADYELAQLAPGESANYTFTMNGTFRYRDPQYSFGYDEGDGMSGVVIVSSGDNTTGSGASQAAPE